MRQHIWLWLEHELASLKRIIDVRLPCEGILLLNNMKLYLQLLVKSCIKFSCLFTFAIDVGVNKNFHKTLLTAPPPSQLVGGQPGYVMLENRKFADGFFVSPLPSKSEPTWETVEQSRARQLHRTAWLKVFLALSLLFIFVCIPMHSTNFIPFQSNVAFVYSLINFCGLHGASGVDLHPVRMELLQLIDECFTLEVVVDRAPFSCEVLGRRHRFFNAVPLLRSVFLVPPGVMHLPRPLYLIKV